MRTHLRCVAERQRNDPALPPAPARCRLWSRPVPGPGRGCGSSPPLPLLPLPQYTRCDSPSQRVLPCRSPSSARVALPSSTLPDAAAGKKVKCPKCQSAMLVPEACPRPRPSRWWTNRRPTQKPIARVKTDVFLDDDEDDRPRKKKKQAADNAMMVRNIIGGVLLLAHPGSRRIRLLRPLPEEQGDHRGKQRLNEQRGSGGGYPTDRQPPWPRRPRTCPGWRWCPHRSQGPK